MNEAWLRDVATDLRAGVVSRSLDVLRDKGAVREFATHDIARVALVRLGRSLGHLIEVATVPGERSVFLRSLTEGFDTSTACGRLFYHILGAVAEFEREVIKERTIAGMKAAKKRGTHIDRPQALVGSRLAEAGRMLAAGKSPIEMARISTSVAGNDSTGVPRW